MARSRSGKAVCAQDSKKGASDVPLLIFNVENSGRHTRRRVRAGRV